MVQCQSKLFHIVATSAGCQNRSASVSTHATLAKYSLRVEESSDAFSKKGRRELALCFTKLPAQTLYATELLLQQLDSVLVQIAALEKRMKEVFEPNKDRTFPSISCSCIRLSRF